MGTRVVVDTNVLVSALGWRGASWTIIRMCVEQRLHLLLSSEILKELERVLAYPKFEFSQEEISEYMELVTQTAEIVEPDFRLSVVADDPSDDRILECAQAGGADVIVSGDRHLKALGSYEGIAILPPRALLDWLAESDVPR